jgi:hypothetical protein
MAVINLIRLDTNPYAQIPNDLIRDPRLTSNAFRILAYLMSHKDGYELTYNQITRQTTLKEAAINSARDLLTDLGFITWNRPKRTDGKFAAIDWVLLDITRRDETVWCETSMDLVGDNKNTNSKEEQLEEVNVAQSETEQRFSEFWDSYPHRKGDHKKPAKTAFCRLTIKNQKEAIAGAKLYASHPDVPPKGSQDRRFIPMAATWLHQERWNEIEETQKPVTKEVKPRWASS